MLKRYPYATMAGLAFALVACSSDLTDPRAHGSAPQYASAAPMPDVRISEIHYDNTGTDADERIEISGPAGTNVAGWQVALYNGSGGGTYNPIMTLSGTIPATCGARGVVVLAYLSNGIQNGSPDGIALVDGSNTVIEFLSYEGTFTATASPALGLTSTDIGVAQSGAEPLGSSIQRNGSGVWAETEGSNTFGACNDDVQPPAGPITRVEVTPGSASIVEDATQQFNAAAFDASSNAVTTTFTWTTSAPSVATVSAAGLATGHAPGDAFIIATAPNGVADSASLHVDEAPPPVSGDVRIVEIHYDNVGTDTGEAIEIQGPAGLSLTGWSIVLYNGSSGASYNTQALTGVFPATCGTRGVLVVDYPSGIQNGGPDGVALVNSTGTVVEFLSYEGTFTGVGGPANGLVSTDIVVNQNPDNSVPTGLSLQRDTAGVWYGPHASTLGACNAPAPPPPPAAASIIINEIMADPLNAPGGASWGEWFEVHNYGTTPVDLHGWTIASAGGASQPAHVIGSSVVVPAGGYALLGRGSDPALNGGVTLDYNYFSGGSSTIFLDGTDYLLLRDNLGVTVDSVRWTSSSTMAKGVTRGVRDALAANANVEGSNWGYATTTFGNGDYGTPDAANGTPTDTPPAVPNSMSFSGRLASDPALPVGFEDQIFATLRNGSGATVPTTFTWTTETPAIASIDGDGVFRALAAGTAVLRATAADGTTATYSLPTRVGASSTTAQYGRNTEFGVPTDADGTGPDDFLVEHAQYKALYSDSLGTPNWVSYNLEATHFGAEDRCDCFTFDAALPAGFTRYTTADYTGAGTFHGYAIDRGHLARSFDRTSASLDNATTFYFSNIIPQAADQNQGPWAILENYLGDLARLQNREVYISAGVAGNKGTLKNEGTIVIPTHTWKVAVIMPRDQGLSQVDDAGDIEVVAVIMPNEPGVRNVSWETYKTTVDAVEALSGYDVLALLPDHVEIAVESNTHMPSAVVDGPYGAQEGGSVSMSAAGSSDPDGDALTYAWSFGDGQNGTGATVTHTYTQDGAFTVRLIVTDIRGLADTTSTTATITNVAPAIAPIPGDTLLPGETYRADGSFTDPGADAWTATVNYGGGSATAPLTLTGKSFTLAHSYVAPGAYTVTVRVSDDDVTSAETTTVTVLTPVQGIENVIALVDQLVAAGSLQQGNGNGLTAKLNAAASQIGKGNDAAARGILGALLNEIEAFARARRLSEADAVALHSAVTALLQSLG